MKKALFLLSLLVISSLSIVSAGLPMIPVVFNGSVSYTGNPSLNLQGHNISVAIGDGNTPEKAGVVSAGNKYEIMIDPQGDLRTIYFYVGGIKAAQTGEYVKGGFIILDLTINQSPVTIVTLYCGDGSCNNGETCSSCSNDCGTCPINNNTNNDEDNSHSSSGGGGSSSGTISLVSSSNDDSDGTTFKPTSSKNGNTTAPITGGAINEGNLFTLKNMSVLLAGLVAVLIVMIIVLVVRKN